MTKTILFAAAFALFSFVGLNATPAQACATCGCAGAHAHSEAKKAPCTKCLKAGKPCKCGAKAHKPCEKTLGEKKTCCGKCTAGKPCEKKLHKAEMSDHINTTPMTATKSYNSKGSLILKSKQSFTSSATGQYN